jgi:hypothetical protein
MCSKDKAWMPFRRTEEVAELRTKFTQLIHFSEKRFCLRISGIKGYSVLK